MKKAIIILFALYLNIETIAHFLYISSGLLVFWSLLAIFSLYYVLKEKLALKVFTHNNTKYFIALYLLIIIQGFFSIMWTRAPDYGFNKLIYGLLKLVLTIPLALLVSFQINLFLKYLKLFSFLIIIFVITKYGNPITLILTYGVSDRLGMDEGPIAVGRFFGMAGILYFISFSFEKSKIIKFLLIILVVLALIFNLLSGSKGPVFSFLITCIIYYLVSRGNILRIITKIGSIAFISLLLFFIIKPFISNHIIGEFFYSRFIDNTRSYDGRVYLYDLAINEYSNANLYQLFFGSGAGDFGMVEHHADQSGYPHNSLIEILYEYGLWGLSVFLLMLLSIFHKTFRSFVHDRTPIIIFAAISIYYVFNSLFTGDFTYNFQIILYFLIFSFSSSVLKIQQNTNVPIYNSKS